MIIGWLDQSYCETNLFLNTFYYGRCSMMSSLKFCLMNWMMMIVAEVKSLLLSRNWVGVVRNLLRRGFFCKASRLEIIHWSLIKFWREEGKGRSQGGVQEGPDPHPPRKTFYMENCFSFNFFSETLIKTLIIHVPLELSKIWVQKLKKQELWP